MEIRKSKIWLTLRLTIIVTTVYTLVGVAAWALFKFIIPQQHFGYFPSIGIFFLANGLLLNYVLNATKNSHPKHLLNVYMLSRVIKLMLTVIFLLFYVKLVGESNVAFAITLMAFYIVYMILELYIYFLYEKRRKANEKKSENG